ncbi:MAG: RidA family protein [Elusimicrobiota bacterium]|jgi:2-iminobutanoate/2-iminopropanoate deaminase|nr:RidA family protein [Elusimicrobiota bacterium]
MQTIKSNNAPEAVGPYSQAVKAGGFLFISGQIPLNPKTMSMPQDIKEQTKQCLTNIEAILKEAGLNLKDVVNCRIYTTKMGDFNLINEVYGTFFNSCKPSRVCVEVSALPKGALIEIEATAICGQ